MSSGRKESEKTLSPYFSRLGAWAFSIGTSIGWGSFVVTCNTYLLQAGVAGTVGGLLLGMAVILVINHNLCYMMGRVSDAGGIYTYGRRIIGRDAGFLIAWLLLLTYMAVLWANISSLPLFARRFMGAVFQFGYCYTVFGYDVYIGEVLLSVAAIVLIGLLCSRSRRLPQYLMIGLAVLFTGTVVVCAAAAVAGQKSAGFSYDPAYIPDKNQLEQILRIAVISPWAFIGFENVAHFSEEFAFPAKKIRGVMLASVLLTTAFYIFMTLLSASAYPERYGSWLEYIGDMNNLSGIEAIPAFYAASRYMGRAGVFLLTLALFSVILTSLIGNLTALSRLFYAFGRDHSWTGKLGTVNRHGIPARAMLVTVVISCFIPFLGRTAIVWIVDVTTLGATIVYGFQSQFVFKDARDSGDRREVVTGALGMGLMIGFAVLLLAPKLMSYEAMEAESYLLFVVWSFLGLIVFRYVLYRDEDNKYGHSIIVWIVLLLLMLMTIMMWETGEVQRVTEDSLRAIQQFYDQRIALGSALEEEAREFLAAEGERISGANSMGAIFTFVLFMAALILTLNNFMAARRREAALESALSAAREFGMTDPLTGVKNKHAYIQWQERLDRQIGRGEAGSFAVVVCDINNLKSVNDVYGHAEGDDCIRRACTRICRTFAHSPVFRYGGDEFVVLLTGDDYERREELMRQISELSPEDRKKPGAGIAAGMVEYREGAFRSLSEVFEQADEAMYERKKQMHAQA